MCFGCTPLASPIKHITSLRVTLLKDYMTLSQVDNPKPGQAPSFHIPKDFG